MKDFLEFVGAIVIGGELRTDVAKSLRWCAQILRDEIDYQLARALDLIRGVAIFGNLKPAS